MDSVEESRSSSDVSSTSSWTVLDQESSLEHIPTPKSDCFIIETEAAKTPAEPDEETQSKPEMLTLEEYMAERVIEHDYEYDEKALQLDEMMHSDPKKDKRKFKVPKAPPLGALAIMGAILSIAGIAFLCLPTSGTFSLKDHKPLCAVKIENAKDALKIIAKQNHMSPCSKNKNKLVYVEEAEDTMKLLDRVTFFNRFSSSEKEILKEIRDRAAKSAKAKDVACDKDAKCNEWCTPCKKHSFFKHTNKKAESKATLKNNEASSKIMLKQNATKSDDNVVHKNKQKLIVQGPITKEEFTKATKSLVSEPKTCKRYRVSSAEKILKASKNDKRSSVDLSINDSGALPKISKVNDISSQKLTSKIENSKRSLAKFIANVNDKSKLNDDFQFFGKEKTIEKIEDMIKKHDDSINQNTTPETLQKAKNDYKDILEILTNSTSAQNIFMAVLQDLILLRLTQKVSQKLKLVQSKLDGKTKKSVLEKTNINAVSIPITQCTDLAVVKDSTKLTKKQLFGELPFKSLLRKKTDLAMVHKTLSSPQKSESTKLKAQKSTNKVLKATSNDKVAKQESVLSIELLQKSKSEKRRAFLEEIQKQRDKRQEILEKMRVEKQKFIEQVVKDSKKYNIADKASSCLIRLINKSSNTNALQSKTTTSLATCKKAENKNKKVENSASSSVINMIKQCEKKTANDLTSRSLASTLPQVYKSDSISSKAAMLENSRSSLLTRLQKMKDYASDDTTRAERHEQLKKYWNARQKYMEKRVEICEMLKEKISEKLKDENEKKKLNNGLAAGVYVIDRIISDILVKTDSETTKTSKLQKSESVINNIMPSASTTTMQRVLQAKDSNSKTFESAIVPYQKANKKTKELYEFFFEEKGPEVYEEDRRRWFEGNQSNSNSSEFLKRSVTSRQDPRRSYKTKVLLNKKNL